MKKKTLIFLHPHFMYPGGAGKYLIELIKRIPKKNFEIVIICINYDSKNIREIKNKVIFRLLKGPLSNNFLFWALLPLQQIKINKIINEYDDKIIIANVFPANWWAFRYIKKNRNEKCLWICHEPSAFVHEKIWTDSIKNPIMRNLNKIFSPILKKIDIGLAQYATEFITNSKFSSKNIKNIYGRKSTIIYPGIDIKKFRPGLIKEKIIFTISHLTKFKNIDIMIKVFARIEKKLPDYKMIIAGEGEEKENLIALTKKLKIKNIKFVGVLSQKELIRYYQKAKIFITTAIREPFGITPIEAAACGTPTIAFNSGGIKETVINGKTGFLVPPKNLKKLEQMIIKITYLNEKDYHKLSQNAYKRAVSNFSWEKSSKKFNQLLSKYS